MNPVVLMVSLAGEAAMTQPEKIVFQAPYIKVVERPAIR